MPNAARSMDERRDYRPLSLVVGFAFFMEQLDSTIIAPAIPDIAREFGVDPLALSATMTVYLLCSVAFIPSGGHLAGRFGTRRVFVGALALFAASSLLCAVSGGLVSLTLARAAQGLAAAWMVPVGRTTLVHATPRARLVAALAWMITPAMLGPLVGPLLGGLLTTWLSWPWIFLVNVPIGLLGLVAAMRWVPQVVEPPEHAFDVVGWLVLAAILAGVVAALEWGRRGDATIGWLAGLVPLGALVLLYVRRSGRSANPVLDLALLRIPTFAASFWSGALVRVGYGALPFLLPLMLQIGLGATAIESGLVLLASGAVAFVTKTQTAKLLRRFGFRRVLVVNGVLCAVALAAFALFRARWGLAAIALSVSFAGFFRSVQFNAVAAIAYADLPPGRIAAATTLNTMVQQLAVMSGISLSALVIEHAARSHGRVVPGVDDFAVAWIVVAAVALAALPACWRLDADAGQALSGYGDPR